MTTAPFEWLQRARTAEQAGSREEALATMRSALEEHPEDPQLHNSAGSFAMRADDAVEAEKLFAKARKLAPGTLEFVLNHAIALGKLGRHGDALDLLLDCEGTGAPHARYWSIRGTASRDLGDLAAAAECYERCLAIEPGHVRALGGRARIALDRAETDVLARHDRALAKDPGNADLWLGKAQALEMQGDRAGATQIAKQLADQAPSWLEGLRYYAQMRLARGDADFAAHYAEAARKVPVDPNIPSAHASVLASLDHAAEAAEVAAAARRQFPHIEYFAFLEAVHAGASGDDKRAGSIFADLSIDTPERQIHEARHCIRIGDFDKAENLLDKARRAPGAVHSAYALLGIIWRLTDDPRAHWLNAQDGLVQRLPLREAESILEPAIEQLHELHDASPLPLGQSLRGGSQTRNILFNRTEPIFARLHAAILGTLEDYRAGLPPLDAEHPVLRHRATPWKLAGSWSVRLSGGGDYHTSHIHPQGVISSALYLVVPEETAGPEKKGWLEVGRPPPDLRLDLGPITTIKPEPGYLALFPSTLYHGTTPFGEAQRMTVAFDVVTVP